jgi:hypothetical protein
MLHRILILRLHGRKVCRYPHAPQHPQAVDALHRHQEHVLVGEEALHWGLIQDNKHSTRRIMQHVQIRTPHRGTRDLMDPARQHAPDRETQAVQARHLIETNGHHRGAVRKFSTQCGADFPDPHI